jgi:hypothetical protein
MHTRYGRLRSLANLRTLSALNSQEVAPHTAYMRITSLELEKLRLSRVRQHALRRIAEIDARYAQIAAEKAKLLAVADGNWAGVPERSQNIPRARGFRARGASGLSLRY